MGTKKSSNNPARVLLTLMIVVVVLLAVFLCGRYGWKLGGFNACQSAGIQAVEVRENSVHLTGFYPGSFPAGFCGYYAKEQGAKLYVGFRFSAVFGIFETGDFDITIPVKGEIDEVIVKTNSAEYSIWKADAEPVPDDTEPIPAPEETPTVLDAYATVIGEYCTALLDGWDAAQMMEAGLNYMAADSFFDAPLEDIGYTVTDLDGDGVEELAIGSRREDDFFGKMIFSLYTLDGSGAPMLVFDGTERNRYYYAGGCKFANLGSSAWNDSFVTTLKLEDREMIDMTYTTDPAAYVQMELTPLSQWAQSAGAAG